MDDRESEFGKFRGHKPELVVETKTTKVVKFEQRKSRLYKNNIEILVNNTKPKEDKEAQENNDPYAKKLHREKSLPLESRSPNIQKLKSTLFEQNQDFRKWKKYYDLLSPASKSHLNPLRTK